MKTRSWIALVVAMGALGFAAVACGSSDDTSGDNTTPPAGGAAGDQTGGAAGSTAGSSTGGAAGSTAGSSTGGAAGETVDGGAGAAGSPADAGGDAICKTPTTLHPPSADAGTNTIYCPFSGIDGGSNDVCDHTSEHCCLTAQGSATPSACHPKTEACGTQDIDLQCEDPGDCGSGQSCCAGGTLKINTDPNCANYASHFASPACKASCAADDGSATSEMTLCTSDAQCGTGKTCVPFGAKGMQLGACH